MSYNQTQLKSINSNNYSTQLEMEYIYNTLLYTVNVHNSHQVHFHLVEHMFGGKRFEMNSF